MRLTRSEVTTASVNTSTKKAEKRKSGRGSTKRLRTAAGDTMVTTT